MLLDLSIVLDYVGDGLFGKANLVEHDVLVVCSLSCDTDTKKVLGIAGVGDVVVLRDEFLKLVGKGLTSEEEDIVNVDRNDKGVCYPSNLPVEDECVRVGLSTLKTKVLHCGTKMFVPLATSLLQAIEGFLEFEDITLRYIF